MNAGALGRPRVHYRRVDSTNARARELAGSGAPHGTLVTAGEQTAGRGRQGRRWEAPAGRALLCSVLLREPPRLLPLAAGVAVAHLAGDSAQLKWPNDVLLEGRKVAGVLVEGRLREGWAVLGIGVNVAVREGDLPEQLRGSAGTLALDPGEVESTLVRLLSNLERWLAEGEAAVLAEVRARDALLGRTVRWDGRQGVGSGIDEEGRLLVLSRGEEVALAAGEVHLAR